MLLRSEGWAAGLLSAAQWKAIRLSVRSLQGSTVFDDLHTLPALRQLRKVLEVSRWTPGRGNCSAARWHRMHELLCHHGKFELVGSLIEIVESAPAGRIDPAFL